MPDTAHRRSHRRFGKRLEVLVGEDGRQSGVLHAHFDRNGAALRLVHAGGLAGYHAVNPDFVAISFPEGEGLDPGFRGACVGLRKSDDALLDMVNEILATVDQEQRDALWDTALNSQPT